MARAMWSGFLGFGLVSIPVGMYSATVDGTIHFHQLHRGTSHRIRYKKVDEATGEEVPASDIASGYDLGGGEYVVVTKEELKQVAAGRSETIEISDFVDLDQIDPIYFRQSYYLAPRGKGGERAYGLLRQVMSDTGKVGVATMVLRDKEHLVAVRPTENVLLLETLYFADEIRDPLEELERLPGAGGFQARELEVAKALVQSLATKWDPDRYHDTYRSRVEELIQEKREGHEVVFEAESPKANVIDLMAALEASLARAGSGTEAPGRPAEPGGNVSDTDLAERGGSDPETEPEEGARSRAGRSRRSAEREGGPERRGRSGPARSA